jgi:hypothetical protein
MTTQENINNISKLRSQSPEAQNPPMEAITEFSSKTRQNFYQTEANFNNPKSKMHHQTYTIFNRKKNTKNYGKNFRRQKSSNIDRKKYGDGRLPQLGKTAKAFRKASESSMFFYQRNQNQKKMLKHQSMAKLANVDKSKLLKKKKKKKKLKKKDAQKIFKMYAGF